MPVETPAKPALPPSDWRVVPLKDVADVRFSSVDKLTLPGETKVRLCNYTDIYNNDYITPHFDFMEASASDSEIARFGLFKGDLIITKDSETPDDIGIPCVIDETAPDLVCGYHLGLIRPDLEKVDPTFLSKQIGHRRIARYFAHQANGLTRYGLPIGSVQDAPLWLPDLAEQNSIGVLLRKLDALISASEAVIAKLRQVRSGLLHDLLTRGLDAHGQLRDPATHPEQFKDSPVGRIPKEWEVSKLEDLAQVDRGKFAHRPRNEPRFFGGSHKFIQTGDVADSAGEVLYESSQTLSEEGCAISREFPIGTIAVTIAANIADTAILGAPMYLTDSVVGVVVHPPHTPRFIELSIRMAKRGLCARAPQTAQMNINLQDLRPLLIALPRDSREESHIAELYETHDRQLVSEQATLAKLRQIKSGLMTDLLEGRVRVPEEAARHAAAT
jgi:type I restriction enzyme S subunit